MEDIQDPTPHSLVYRTAQRIYMADSHSRGKPEFSHTSVLERRRYFRMAQSALAEALMEPVREPVPA